MAIVLGGKLAAPVNNLDANYAPDGACYWASIDAFKAEKEDSFEEPLPYTTILAKGADGKVKEFINNDESDVWKFVEKTSEGTSVEVVDNLTTSSSTKALSAKQGKTLQDSKLDKTEAASSYATIDALDSKLDASTAASTYASKSSLNNYLKTTDAAATYATVDALDNKLDASTAATQYATKSSLNSYLKTTDAAATYATQDDLSGKLDASTAASTYASKSSLNDYVKTTDAEATYATQDALAGKLDASTAASTYASKTSLNDYVKASDAASTYATISDLTAKADSSELTAQIESLNSIISDLTLQLETMQEAIDNLNSDIQIEGSLTYSGKVAAAGGTATPTNTLVLKKDGVAQSVTFSFTSSQTYATVASDGKVTFGAITGTADRTATITAACVFSGKTYKKTATVTQAGNVTKLEGSLSYAAPADAEAGSITPTNTLKLTKNGTTVSGATISFTSNKTWATVNASTGVVTLAENTEESARTATITASCTYEGNTYTKTANLTQPGAVLDDIHVFMVGTSDPKNPGPEDFALGRLAGTFPADGLKAVASFTENTKKIWVLYPSYLTPVNVKQADRGLGEMDVTEEYLTDYAAYGTVTYEGKEYTCLRVLSPIMMEDEEFTFTFEKNS